MKKALLALLVLIGLAALPSARADVMPNLTLPPWDNGPLGGYLSPAAYHARYDNKLIANRAIHWGWLRTFTPPDVLGASTNEVFNSMATFTGVQYSTDNGTTWISVGDFSAPALTTILVTNVGPLSYDTEMTGLDIDFSTPLGLVKIKEDPARASTGHTTLTWNSVKNGYEVDSFFDVYTEISFDNGGSWTQSDGPVRMYWECPEPSAISLGLLGLGLAGLARCRRGRKA